MKSKVRRVQTLWTRKPMIMMFITRKMSTPFRIVNICFFPGVRIDVRRAEHEVATGRRRGRVGGRRSGRHRELV